MKKRIFSRVLALFMALSLLTTTVFAASFDDLQNAIDGNTSAGIPITDSNYQNHYGYGQNENGGYGVESWKEGDTSNVKLNEDVTYTESDKNSTITVGEGKDVNLDLNDNNITGNGKDTVIEVEGSLTINGADKDTTASDQPQNTISKGSTGIDVKEGGELALDGVTVTGNEIGVAFVDPFSVTFIGDQNVVTNNAKENISGTGKVNFKLGDTTYKVDAKTAETLLADKDSVAAHGDNWILAKNGEKDTYTVVYTKETTGISKTDVSNAISGAAKAAECETSAITGFVIPEEVTAIGDSAFLDRKDLQTVVIPAGVKRFENNAFRGCTNLSVELPKFTQLEHLGYWAFKDCVNLTGSVYLPATLSTIDYAPFKNCENLTGVVFEEGNTKLTSLGGDTFEGCKNLTGEVVIPDGITQLGGTFNGCSKLEKVSMGNKITKFGTKTFFGCTALTTIELPESLTTIGENVFSGCTGLTGEIVIPANVTTIGAFAFNECSNITSVAFAEGSKLELIKDAAFRKCGNLKSITLPEGLKTIGKWQALGTLTTVVFPSTLTNVAGDGFLEDVIKSAILYATEDTTEENIKTSVEAIQVALKEKANVYVVNSSDDLEFYRGAVTANFGHYSTDNDVNRDDGSVNLTNVSGTITTDKETVTLPDVAGITASIDTDGKITLYVPGAITVNGREYPDGADVTVEPDGNISAVDHPSRSDDPPVISFDFDAITADTSTTIEDEEVPLAGLVTLAELLEALREYEGIEDVELPEDFQWIDHDYAQAIYWGLDEALVVDTEDDPLDPDEIVTVALLREVLENFVEYKGVDLTVTVEGEDDMIVMDLGERLTVFYGELEAALSKQAA